MKLIIIADSREQLIEEWIEREVEYLKGVDYSRERRRTGGIRMSEVEKVAILREEARQRVESFLNKYDIAIARNEAERELLKEQERQREREEFEQGFQEWKKARLGGNL